MLPKNKREILRNVSSSSDKRFGGIVPFSAMKFGGVTLFKSMFNVSWKEYFSLEAVTGDKFKF